MLVIVDKSAFSPFLNVHWLCCPICAFFGRAGTYADCAFFGEGWCMCWLLCWTSMDDRSSPSMRGWPASRLLHNPGFHSTKFPHLSGKAKVMNTKVPKKVSNIKKHIIYFNFCQSILFFFFFFVFSSSSRLYSRKYRSIDRWSTCNITHVTYMMIVATTR